MRRRAAPAAAAPAGGLGTASQVPPSLLVQSMQPGPRVARQLTTKPHAGLGRAKPLVHLHYPSTEEGTGAEPAPPVPPPAVLGAALHHPGSGRWVNARWTLPGGASDLVCSFVIILETFFVHLGGGWRGGGGGLKAEHSL